MVKLPLQEWLSLAIFQEAAKPKDDRDKKSHKAGLCILTTPAGCELSMLT